MLRGAITTTRPATITVIEHHHPSLFKILSQQRHQFNKINLFAIKGPKVALTRSHRRARKITRDANNLFKA